jgi:hypothetical protein
MFVSVGDGKFFAFIRRARATLTLRYIIGGWRQKTSFSIKCPDSSVYAMVFKNGLKKEIPNAFMNIDALINGGYVISFKPKNFAIDDKWHKVEIKVAIPKGLKGRIETNYRKGYFASKK